jgi:hypothetical protein
VINTEHEKLVRVPSEAAKIIPGRPHASTVWRWYRHGVRGVRLETIVVGGRRFTSHEAVQRFIARTTAARDGQPARAACERRQQAIAKAEAELAAAGL